MSGGWIWQPTREWIESTNVYRFMRRLGFHEPESFLRFSRDENERFWEELVREVGIEWFVPYQQVVDTADGPEWSRWFTGARLNITWNCLDRHAKGECADKNALIWEGEDGSVRTVTFSQLYEQTNAVANGLVELGLQEGDRVALCMPMVPEVVSILYACFKLGLIAVPIFSGYGAAAIATRLDDSAARIVFTATGLQRRGKLLPLKEKIDQAINSRDAANDPVPVEKVIVWPYQGETNLSHPRDLHWDEFLRPDQECDTLHVDSETRALILYTSGTTGKPKGAVHTHAGALVQTTKEIWLGFDHRPQDRFFWLSDIGWMMGPWELIGNHHFGGTVFLYDGAPDYPDSSRLWSMIERHKLTTFGISPTAVRLLMRYGVGVPRAHDLSSLRLLGSTGEPWDEPSYRWFFNNVGNNRLPIINISGGTEIIGCFLFPLPIVPLKPCSLGGPAPGMAAEVFNEAGEPVRNKTGYLVCTKPAPSMTRGVWRDPQRYLDTYWSRWPGIWNHGDWASVDEDNCWFLHGRADESMNVAGRKVGPAEIEQALMQHPLVAEAVVVGVPDELKGETPVAFIVPKGRPASGITADDLEAARRHVGQSMGAAFCPREIVAVPELPKTQSGKIVRRLIRQRYMGEPLGDLSTVQNPSALDAFHRRTPGSPS
jgi:acetyl-CoA synthetase